MESIYKPSYKWISEMNFTQKHQMIVNPFKLENVTVLFMVTGLEN